MPFCVKSIQICLYMLLALFPSEDIPLISSFYKFALFQPVHVQISCFGLPSVWKKNHSYVRILFVFCCRKFSDKPMSFTSHRFDFFFHFWQRGFSKCTGLKLSIYIFLSELKNLAKNMFYARKRGKKTSVCNAPLSLWPKSVICEVYFWHAEKKGVTEPKRFVSVKFYFEDK